MWAKFSTFFVKDSLLFIGYWICFFSYIGGWKVQLLLPSFFTVASQWWFSSWCNNFELAHIVPDRCWLAPSLWFEINIPSSLPSWKLSFIIFSYHHTWLPMVNFISEILSKDFEAIIKLLLYVKECNKLILPLNTNCYLYSEVNF